MNTPSKPDVPDTRLDELFHAAKRLSPAQQQQFLDDHCSKHPALREELEQLLGAFREAPDVDFHHPLLPKDAVIHRFEAAMSANTEWNEPIQAGTVLGPYRILQQIGEGGMGTVYLAAQSHPVSRCVALKIVKPSMDSKVIIARFAAECQALALMDHPNIAKVLDAGEMQVGRPYFVMELIHGVPLTTYCDEQNLSLRERLELFIPVCEAVAHAHQKAIIHRDLKPSNILVAEYDHHPVPKVIDFGISKAIGQKLTDKTQFTQYGQLMGTIEYMSPEQARLNQLDIDTRSDIYSLGVMLYELMVGTTPFDRQRLRSASFDEMLSIIRKQDPPTPSSRVASREKTDAVALNRRTEPKTLSRRLRGDLDWIVMKCLEKDRDRRYQTASSLAEDLRCHLNNAPVIAGPPTWNYRLKKLLRRHKVLFATSSAILAVLFLGTYISAVQAIRAPQEAKRATQAEQQKQNLFVAERRARQEAERQRDRAQRIIYDAEMARAKRHLDSQMFGEAKKIVDKYMQPELDHLRGWAWRHLWQQTRSDEVATVGRHDYIVDRVRFSPDGHYVVSTGQDRRLIVLDVRRHEKIVDTLHAGKIVAFDVSHEGDVVTKCQGEGLLRFSFLPTSKVDENRFHVAPLDDGMSAINDVRFSPNGHWLAVLSEERLQLWDATTKDVLNKVNLDGGRRIAFSPDNSTLAVATKKGEVKLFKRASLVVSETLSGHAPTWWTGPSLTGNIEFSPDGKMLAYAGGKSHKSLVVWNLEVGEAHILVEGVEFTSDWVGHVDFTRDGSHLISVGSDRRITIWNTHDWSVADRRLGHESDIWSLDVSPDGEMMVTGSSDKTIRLWSVAANRSFGIRQSLAGDQFVNCFNLGGWFLHDLSRGGRWAVICSQEDGLILWDTWLASKFQLPFKASRAQVSADAQLVATEQEGVIRLYRANNRDLGDWEEIDGPDVVADPDFRRWEAGFRISPQQSSLAIARRGGGIVVWKFDDGSRVEFATTHRKIDDISFSSDESLLAVTSSQHMKSACDVFDLVRGNRVSHLQGGPGVFSVALVLSGNKVIATADERASVSLWDLAADSQDPTRPKPFAHFGEARAGLRAFASSPDGRLLATVGAFDEQIHLWDAATQQEVLVLKSLAPVWSLDFSSDGNTLTSACGVMVHRWNVPTLDEIATAERRILEQN